MLKLDAFFFVGVIFFIFLIWLATGGPSHPISWAGPFLNAPAPLGDGRAYFLSGAGFNIGSGGGSLAGFSVGGSGGGLSLGDSYGGQGDVSNPSPYRGVVQFQSSPSDAKESLASLEMLRLRAASYADASLNITGWRLVSSASTATIGTGALVPRNNRVNSTSPIALSPGDTLVVVTGRSPLGVSFRENKCVGYLDQYQSFSPALNNACPSLRDRYEDEVVGDSENASERACLNFLSSMNRCEMVRRFPKDPDGGDSLSTSCRSFITEHASYDACVADHSRDADFSQGVWRIYLGSSAQLWRDTHDTITLLDAQGRTVDVFTY